MGFVTVTLTDSIMNLKGKRILITAGPTQVAIDKVRVISNTATGQTGILLAEKLQKLGAKVTLLLGPVESCCLDKPRPSLKDNTSLKEGRGKRIRLIRFNFFEELKEKLSRELRKGRYHAVIHSAAVSDYGPEKFYRKKVKSANKCWRLSLIPLPKLIDLIKTIDSSVFLAGFKFLPQARKNALIQETGILLRRCRADLVVANTTRGHRYIAYIVLKDKIRGPFTQKKHLAGELIKAIGENL